MSNQSPIVGDPAAVRAIARRYKKQSTGLFRLHAGLGSGPYAGSSEFLDYHRAQVDRVRVTLKPISAKLLTIADVLDDYAAELAKQKALSETAALDLMVARQSLEHATDQKKHLPAVYPPVSLAQQDPYLASRISLAQHDITDAQERLDRAKRDLTRSASTAAGAFTKFTTSALKDPKGEAKLDAKIQAALKEAEHQQDVYDGMVKRILEWAPYVGSIATAGRMAALIDKRTLLNEAKNAGDASLHEEIDELETLILFEGALAVVGVFVTKAGKLVIKKGSKAARKFKYIDDLASSKRLKAFKKFKADLRNERPDWSDDMVQNGAFSHLKGVEKAIGTVASEQAAVLFTNIPIGIISSAGQEAQENNGPTPPPVHVPPTRP